jgi:uroporphyrinogen-III synthase
MPEPRNILVTRELTEEQLDFAEGLGLKVAIEPAISIVFRNDWLSVQSAVEGRGPIVSAFTSRNGVEGFLRFKQAGIEFPGDMKIYAVGGKTAEALESASFDNVKAPLQQDGVGLAHLITDDFLRSPELKDATVLHFCGNRRRDELRHYLTESEIPVKDIVVYKTELNEMQIPDGHFDAILFYSPSAVQAFRNSGGFKGSDLPELFAIGNTTAEELSIESGKPVHVSPEPDTEVFLEFVARVLGLSDRSSGSYKECPPAKGEP